MEKTSAKTRTVRLVITALFLAMNVALSSFGVPVPGGHLYLNDVVICLAAIMLNPFEAFMVGGVGAFLGDFFFYPAPMFVSLVTHGIQAVVISLCSHKLFKKKPLLGAIVGVTIGALIMVAGYTFGRAFIYSTKEYALLKLPFQFLQAGVGAVLGTFLCFGTGIKKQFDKSVR
ncbi:MAG: ECF transporter S component [Clostridia bacterium]|nr:ECF transporter S component [Clostridia bacterium]